MAKILVIDGNSLLFRAYYATAYGGGPIMTSKDGTPTNAIFAFGNMMAKLLSYLKEGDGIFVGFDKDSHTFRKEEFKDYKANRKPCPEDLKPQFPISRELCKAIGVICYEESGIEADDICGSVAKLAHKEGYEVEIYTSDKDYLQLIEDGISVNLLRSGLSKIERVTSNNMEEIFGFSPKQIIDYKALTGDSSDNLPGIPSVGDKTAVKLIQKYGSFDEIVKAAEIEKGKVFENIRTYKEQGEFCYHLASILLDVKLPFAISDLIYRGYGFEALNEFSNKYDLRQLPNRLPQNLKISGAKIEAKKVEIKKISSFEGIEIASPISLVIDVSKDSYHEEDPSGLAIESKGIIYLESWEDAKNDAVLKGILENQDIHKNVFDGKANIYSLNKIGVNLEGIKDDLSLLNYVIDSSSSSEPTTLFSSLGFDINPNNDESEIVSYMCAYLDEAIKLSLRKLEGESSDKLYRDIELPLSKVLAKMEIEGFPISKAELLEIGESFKNKRDNLEQEIIKMAGYSLNVNSPKQLQELLFAKMNLPKSKKGSTSVDSLKDMVSYSPIIPLILEYRKYQKLYSTYIEGLEPYIGSDNKLHSYFNQTQTATGRLSSSSPNLQNISARDEEGKTVRKAFHYDDGSTILSLDYSQIELRVLASLSGCERYIHLFKEGRDIHSETAKSIFHDEEITHDERRKAKAVNFAIIYGTTSWGLSDQIGCSMKEAQTMISDFYKTYPEVGSYLEKITVQAQKEGYVETLLGRRRYFRDISGSNFMKREAALRAAKNAPIQGTAADLIKIAMVKIDDYLTKNDLKTKMVLQIHDELIFKVPSDELKKIKTDIADIMRNAISLSCPLDVSIGIGKSWFDAKE